MAIVNSTFGTLKESLLANPKRWLVTGCAGFIGSHLIEALLSLNQYVVGLDNFSTGYQRNLDEVKSLVTGEQWLRFSFINGDIRDLSTCKEASRGVDYILHQAALGSVPRSISDPLATNASNVDGFLNMLVAGRDAGVSRFVYAASSSTYGDHESLPKVEAVIGRPLSPYAVTKLVNELYAEVFGRCYNLPAVGLRYFNVFGARQDPKGSYAAVIPCWVQALLSNQPVFINGDGKTSRDFCYVQNAVQANLLAATASCDFDMNQVFNVAVGDRTTLNDLFYILRDELALVKPELTNAQPRYRDFRVGDVRHSQADITKIKNLLGYTPSHRIVDGVREAMPWYVGHFE